MKIDPVSLTADLVRCPSVTPEEGGAIDLLEQLLEKNGFSCTRIVRGQVNNLFAKWGNGKNGRVFGFNGHTDVVPVGDLSSWTVDPFGAEIKEGYLYGRGATDMKSGVAAFVASAIDFVNHTRTSYNFDYQNAKKKYIGMTGQPRTSNAGAVHSDKFIKETFKDENKNAKQYVVYRDWQPDGVASIPGQVLRTPQNMVEIIQNRVAYNYHLNNSTVSLGIEGRIDLVPGDVINLITQEPNIALENKQNSRLSGKYLIASVDHSMEMNTLSTKVEAIKYGWQGGDI